MVIKYSLENCVGCYCCVGSLLLLVVGDFYLFVGTFNV